MIRAAGRFGAIVDFRSVEADELDLPIAVQDLRKVLAAHGVLKASIFGSYARGEAGPNSDLDILVEYRPDITLSQRIELIDALAHAVGRPVDVVPDHVLSRHRRPHIERDKVEVL